MLKEQVKQSESLIEVSIEEIIELIRSGESTEVIYKEQPNGLSNIITLQCGDKYCTDIREIKPVMTTHSPVQIYIRSHDKDGIITEWKEYYVHSPSIYSQFRVNKDKD